VSLVLNGKAEKMKVNPDTARKVLEYCKKKNYVLNAHAKRMNSKFSKNIGLILYGGYALEANPLEGYCAAMMSGGLAMEAAKSEFSVTILIFRAENDLDSLLKRFHSKELDGFVSANFPLWDSWNEAFRKNKIPMVAIGGNPEDGLPTVNINDFEMSRQMSEFAIASGKRKFKFLSGNETSYTGNERKRGFMAALENNGLEPCGVNNFVFNEQDAYNGVTKILNKGKRDWDALVCANDCMAVGAVKALIKKGIKVHEDVMVTGADKKSYLEYFRPCIPTYSMLPRERGEESFRLLKAQLDGRLKNKYVILESKLETEGVI
jgi:LacI family transcriptional regulator